MEKNRLQAALERERRDRHVIDLIDTNFHRNGFLFPAEPLARLTAEYFASRSYDPDPKGAAPAREAISRYYRGRGVPIDPGRIVLTASASESYDLLFSTLAERGDRILLPTPGYPLFEYLAHKAGLETVYYRLDETAGYRIDTDSVRRAISIETRFLVLISPNNPTGRTVSDDEIRALLSLCDRYGVMLITDEVFSEFTYSGSPLPRPARFETPVPVFTLNGISKMFACPDLKLSWIAATGPARRTDKLVEAIEISNDVFLSCSSLTQYLLPGLFAQGGNFIREMTEETDHRRRLLVETLSGVPRLSFTEPDGGIHCVLRFEPSEQFHDDEELALGLLTRYQVYLHPGYFYGIESGLAAVVSFLKRPQELEEGLRRLASFLQESYRP